MCLDYTSQGSLLPLGRLLRVAIKEAKAHEELASSRAWHKMDLSVHGERGRGLPHGVPPSNPYLRGLAICHRTSFQHHSTPSLQSPASRCTKLHIGRSRPAAWVSLHELLSRRHHIDLVVGEKAVAQPLPMLCHIFTGTFCTNIFTLGIL